MPTKLTNPSIEPLALPYPFRGVLAGKQEVVIDVSPTVVTAALGGTSCNGRAPLIQEVGAQASYDSAYAGDAGAGTIPFGGDSATSDADLNYDPATDTLNAGANLALKNGSGASRTMGIDAGTALAETLVGAALTVPAGTGGVASAGAAGGVGGAGTVRGGVGGAGSAARAAGAGGAVTVKGGDAGAANTGTGGNGGAASLDAGAATGSGTNGSVSVGATNAEAVNLGRTAKAVSVVGLLGVTVMTTVARDALSPQPAAGTLIYNSTTNKLNVRVAAAWEVITSV